MPDASTLFKLPPYVDGETSRRRYPALAKANPPEQRPEQFAAIRRAYEQWKDLDTRLRYRMFEAGKEESSESIIKEVLCQSPRPRLTLEALRAAHRSS